jgi:CRISPR-associated protein Cmr2
LILDHNSNTLFEIKEKSIMSELTDELEKKHPNENVIAKILKKLGDSELLITFNYLEALGYSDGENAAKQVYVKRRKDADYGSTFAAEGFNEFSTTALDILPAYSFIIEFDFTLEKPCISKDDENFTIIENSIKREKVLSCPYIPGSTWKGCLRSALWHEGMKEDNEQITRIFGNERLTNESFRQGRLHFFPSLFDKVDYEIINPHNRQTRAGTNPIIIECIPAKENGKFSLLYVPFDLVGKEQEETKKQMLEDLKVIAKGLEAMFTVYGFGAKTSSGYGIASNNVKNGRVYTDMSVKIEQESEAMKLPENFRKYLNENGTVKGELVDNATGALLSNKKFQKKKTEHGFQSGDEFSKFKRWYEENGKSYMDSLRVKDSSQNAGEFSSFTELIDLTKVIADMNAQPDTTGGNPDE